MVRFRTYYIHTEGDNSFSRIYVALYQVQCIWIHFAGIKKYAFLICKRDRAVFKATVYWIEGEINASPRHFSCCLVLLAMESRKLLENIEVHSERQVRHVGIQYIVPYLIRSIRCRYVIHEPNLHWFSYMFDFPFIKLLRTSPPFPRCSCIC